MKLASNLILHAIDYANQGNSFIGIRGSGKSYAAMKAAEELMDDNIPIVAIDPIGVWHNLRNGINGNPGYPVIVAGGMHSDLPLSENNIRLLVESALKASVSLVIDLKGISTSNKSQWVRIVASTVETLMELNNLYGPRHIFIEEAAEFVPQKPNPGLNLVYSRIESMARMGRNVGLGYSLLNQRAEEIAKAVFEISEQVFVFRQAGKNSLKSIRDWLDFRGLKDQGITDTLSSLPTGQCWVINENQEIKCTILPKKTFHPDPKQKVNPLPVGVKVANRNKFIDEMRELMALESSDTVRAANAVGASAAGKMAAKKIIELEQTIVTLKTDNKALTTIIKQVQKERDNYIVVLNEINRKVEKELAKTPVEHPDFNELTQNIRVIDRGGKPEISNMVVYKNGSEIKMTADVDLPEESVPENTIIVQIHTSKDKAPMRMLKAAAMFPDGISTTRMCFIAGIKPKGSTFRAAMAWMRSNNYIAEEGNTVFITDPGMRITGPVEKPPGNLVTFWRQILGLGTTAGRSLAALNKIYPNGYTKIQLGSLINVDPDGSTMRALMATLRKNSLISEAGKQIKLSSELF